MLRKCYFPDEGDLEVFDYYSEANCRLECAWKKAEEICGCKPWFVPATDGSQICFVLGNICFEDIMKKIEMEEIEVKCDCQEDCILSRYTLSLKDKNIVERVSTRVWANKTGAPIYYRLGTDELDGNDFTGSHWYNMGKIPFLVCPFKILLLFRGVLERFRWNNYSSRSFVDAQSSYPYC